jgi:peptidoglycan/xylan/chitin deacetylase (PgdA/CDA1 family)
MQSRPSVVVSLDAELVWGFHDFQDIPLDRATKARDSWLELLDLFDALDLPATWAVVGHLLLEECSGDHVDHPAGEEWFANDPGGRDGPDSEWFGRDLVDAIVDGDPAHDIGCHTFSHVDFREQNTTREVAEAELQRCLELADDYGLELESFVFPRNHVGHRDLLAETDFTCYRGLSPDRWYDETPVRRTGKFATYALGATAPPIVVPEVDEYGLVNVPASMYLFGFEGPPSDALSAIGTDPVVRQVELGLERLLEREDGLLHLWLHPNNIMTRSDSDRMREVARRITDYRDDHDVAVETMADVADRALDDG